jgi:hypothetical protein
MQFFFGSLRQSLIVLHPLNLTVLSVVVGKTRPAPGQ